jgi:hypothetical protein
VASRNRPLAQPISVPNNFVIGLKELLVVHRCESSIRLSNHRDRYPDSSQAIASSPAAERLSRQAFACDSCC